MKVHPLAGKPAVPEMLIDAGKLEKAYYEMSPDPPIRPSGSASAPAATGDLLSKGHSTKAISSPSRRRFATTAGSRK
jgi:hypothetical protein